MARSFIPSSLKKQLTRGWILFLARKQGSDGLRKSVAATLGKARTALGLQREHLVSIRAILLHLKA